MNAQTSGLLSIVKCSCKHCHRQKQNCGFCELKIYLSLTNLRSVSRWLTLAARLLRLYIGTESPSSDLSLIVQYLVRHYIPVWFRIRSHSKCTEGPGNLLFSLQLLRDLPQPLPNLIQPVIQRNAYWAHPETVLLAMAAHPVEQVRTRAVQSIQQSRHQSQEQVRPYLLPEVNMGAEDITQLIDWQAELVTEPPLTADLSDAALLEIMQTPLQVDHYPVHTVAVERAVKVVTEASRAVVGEEQRHGFICSRLRHRQQVTTVISKQSFSENVC